MQLIRTLLSLAVVSLLVTSAAVAQSGYSIQLAAYSTPATQKFFEALRQPVQQVKIDDKTYLYVIDGFVSYADADKVRKMAVGKGFPDAIALKTASSRNPALKVKPYTGPTDGDPVPDAAGTAPAAVAATSTPPATTSTPGTYTSTSTTKPATPPATTSQPAASQTTPTTTYSSGGNQPAASQATPTYSSSGSRPAGQQTPPTGTYSSTTPATTTPASTATPPVATNTKPAATTPAATTQPATPTKPAKTATPAARKPTPEELYGYKQEYNYDDPNQSPSTRGTTAGTNTLGGGESGGGYNQNFDINENTVRALVGKGNVSADKVAQNELSQGTNVVFFDYNKALLRTNAEQEMARLATKLINNIGYSLEIRAHTDAIGPDSYNDELSERRGKSAMIYMLRKGVPSSRVTFRAFGETRPLADNSTPDGADNPMGRQINRRVELVVKDAYGAVIETVTLP